MKEIQEQLPKIVSETVDRYMNSKSVEVKVDEASVKSVKSKITDLFLSSVVVSLITLPMEKRLRAC